MSGGRLAWVPMMVVGLWWPFHPKSAPPKPVPVPPTIAQGARLYHQACLSCHGPRGNGQGFVDLPNGRLAPPLDRMGKSDGELYEIIAQGRGAMPGFNEVLSKNEIHSLVMYVASLSPEAKKTSLWRSRVNFR